MSKNLLDLMPPAEAQKALERAKNRLDRQSAKKGLDVSPEIFLVAEFGYYFGWEAVLAVRRGYTTVPITDSKGKTIYKQEVFTLAEAQVLLEGARKVWYSKLVEQTHAGVISNGFSSSSKSFDSAIKPFTDRTEISE